ncbi:MAG: DUF1328 domain-containing protein [Desulfobacterales bacterium]
MKRIYLPGFTGIAAASAGIAKILFFIFLVIFIVFLIMRLSGRRPRKPYYGFSAAYSFNPQIEKSHQSKESGTCCRKFLKEDL